MIWHFVKHIRNFNINNGICTFFSSTLNIKPHLYEYLPDSRLILLLLLSLFALSKLKIQIQSKLAKIRLL